jgi:hypothetical protein
MRILLRSAVLVLITVLVASACGNDDDTDTPENGETTEGTTVQQDPEEVLAEVARLTDPPGEWERVPTPYRAIIDQLEETMAEVPACDEAPQSFIDIHTDAAGLAFVSFEHPQGANLSNEVLVFGDAGQVDELFAGLESDELLTCLSDFYAELVGVDIGIERDIDDEHIAFSGEAGDLILEQTYLRSDEVVSVVTLQGPAAEIDHDELVEAARDQLEAATAAD